MFWDCCVFQLQLQNTVFAQDQVSEYRAPDHSKSMSWDLLIPEGQQGSGLTGGKGSLTTTLHPLDHNQCRMLEKMLHCSKGIRKHPEDQLPGFFFCYFISLLFPVSLNLGLSQIDNEQPQLGTCLFSEERKPPAKEFLEIQILSY